ncbi:unnamed protein product [Timema podura]|uniref:Histone H2A C-terminal domain-containing protein n=1 Tax=Timema podura TaxID=61482 RepID=A0ABN7PLC6_TIMPD|nr:unnamed protein product [Timema podura]
MTGNAARGSKKTRTIQLNQQMAIRNDEEHNKFLSGVTVTQSGILPNIQAVLLPKKTDKKAKTFSSSCLLPFRKTEYTGSSGQLFDVH